MAKYRKADVFLFLKNILLIVTGTLMLSLGTAVFILPFDLVSGGVSGIAIVVYKILPFEFITQDMIITALTWTLFLIGALVLGKSFAMKTFISTLIYPLGVSLFMKLASPDFLGGFFYLNGYEQYPDIALIISTVIGGVCVGAGCAVTFLGGGSTGGVDIIAFTICKIFKRAKHSVVMFIVDAAIIISGMFVIQDLIISLLGIISAFVSATMVDKVFIGSYRSFIAQIITDNYQEINREVIQKLDRSSTIIDAVGGYTGSSKKIVMVSFKVNQYAELLNLIHRIDKNAFVTIHQAHEITGEGWTR